MKAIALGFVLLLLCLVFSPCVSAEEETEDFAETVPSEFSALLEGLPDELAALLPDSLFSENTADVGSAVQEMSSFSFLLKSFLASLGLSLREGVALLVSVVGLLLLSAVASSLRTSFKSEGIGQAVGFCSSLLVLSLLLTRGYESIRQVEGYFSTLMGFSRLSIPLIGALYAMGGNVTAAAASSAGLGVYLALLDEVISHSILPFCGICLALSLLSSPVFGVSTGGLLSTVKKQYATLLAFLMMLLLAMLATQTTLSARADTLAMRSVKFAAGNLIPVVGGSVSELIRTVSAGVGYLRGTIGLCGTILLLLSLLPPLCRLLLYRLIWQISASLAELLGCDAEKRLLDEIASLNGYLITAVSICSSALLLSYTLLAHCASAIG